MHSVHTAAILFFSLILITAGSELDYDGWLHLRLWHAVNEDPVPRFVERGNITVTSLRSAASAIGQIALQDTQIVQLRRLAENDREYRLKATVRSSSGVETTFLTSVPACYLLGSRLTDSISVWLDGAAEPVAISISSSGPCTLELPRFEFDDGPQSYLWTTNVQIRYPDAGPVPDTATYIQKLEREREARERGETKDNRSFLAKYWMYIVPAVIFVLLSSATNPEAGGGAQRQ